MAQLTVTMAAGSETGATIRKLANLLEQIAADIPDRVPTGASTTLVIDNAPATGTVSVQVTGGPYPSTLKIV